LHICQFKTIVSGILKCSKHGHSITTAGCPYCPDRSYPKTNPVKKSVLNK